jgi:membrane protease YdiL (CAAX protease family)
MTTSSGVVGGARRLLARHPVAAFLLTAYAVGWAVQLAAVKLGFSPRYASSVSVLVGLALPAVLVTAATGGAPAVRDLVRRCLRWRVGLRWYALALLGMLAGTLLGAALLLGGAPLTTLAAKWPLLFTMFLPEVLVALVLIQFWEEAAWTGFLQHTLQRRHGPLLAAVMVAPAFALSHLMFDLLESDTTVSALVKLAVQVVIAILLRVVIAWLYNGAGHSVLVAAIFHAAFNSATGSGGMRFTHELFATSQSASTALWVPLGVLAASAAAVAVRRLRRAIPARTSSAVL